MKTKRKSAELIKPSNQDEFNRICLEDLGIGASISKTWTDLENAGAKKPQIEAAFSFALDYFKNAANTDKAFEFGKALYRLELLHLRCLAIQDYKGALGVQKEINKLLKLYTPSKSERQRVYEVMEQKGKDEKRSSKQTRPCNK